VTPSASIDRLRRAWQAAAGGAAEQALLALLLAAIVGGAHLARLGTAWARGATGAGIACVAAWQIALAVQRGREARSSRLAVRRVLFATDPAAGGRALRALTLVDRAASDASVGSDELAELHLSRLVDRVSSEAVTAAAGRYAQRFRAVSIVLLCGASIAVVMGPVQVVEGLDVLAAHHGRAPLTMSWLGYPRLSALPPSYTREAEHALVLGTRVELPKGTVITVRGVPRATDRTLVVTNAGREEPFAPDGAGGIVARITVRSDAALRVAARFGDVLIDDEESLEIKMVADAMPSVELEGAPRTVRLAEVSRIDLRWAARDDHGLREVDLVMRSGVREERRVIGRFDGETRFERGGRVVLARDAFLRRMFLPVSIGVEVKDNDPLDGPKWSRSPVITVIPPDMGQPEAERFAALLGIRDALVDLLKWRASTAGEPEADRARETRAKVGELTLNASNALHAAYVGATMPQGLRAFVTGQLGRLDAAKREPGEDAIESVILALDGTLGALGNRDATEVAKKLGDVAEEAALAARFARETENRQGGLSRLGAALDTIDRGAPRLEVLAALGRDLGGVTRADAGRVRRSMEAGDLTHAELAALHLAARLRRPTASFGATTASSHGGKGVESGQARGGAGGDGTGVSPSSAGEDFDRAANAVANLAAEHESTVHGVESALEEARHAEPTRTERDEARRLADGLRDAVDSLPLPGQEFGSPRAGAALAREHAKAAAHALDDFALEEARGSAESALDALDQAERRLDADDPLRERFGSSRRALREAIDWAKRTLAERRASADRRAKSTLEQASDTEKELADRAAELAEGPSGSEAALPRESAERLGRAGSVMREAAKELAAGHGEKGAELQREAQRLLEQSRQGRATDAEKEPAEDDEPAEQPRPSDRHGDASDAVAVGGPVPGPDDRARAEAFRRRVVEGLGRDKSERLSPAVRRYAEGLLR
jgi:hypothetical protein